MLYRLVVVVCAVMPLLAAPLSCRAAEDKVFTFAFQGDLRSLDPYALNETFSLGILTNVYEGLVTRDADLRIRPGLATRWERLSPKHWRFHLRKGVKFHNGNPFTADDVIFSAKRVRLKSSSLRTRVPTDAEFKKIDDYTVDVYLTKPDPILLSNWASWAIMDREWTLANDSFEVVSPADKHVRHANLNANGTGPFRVVSHKPGVRTVFAVNAGWWGEKTHNLSQVIFTPIKSAPTRVAAVLSGQVDLSFPIPVQDQQRIKTAARTYLAAGPELRTIFIGMDQHRAELLESSVKGRNPFKDKRVRQAIYHAIDIETIRSKIMQGQSQPAANLIARELFRPRLPSQRLPFDPEKARRLLAKAGYPNGFSVGFDCPNDRYINDEDICVAIVGMLARIGIKVNLNAQPKSLFYAKVLGGGGYRTSMYLLGYTPASLDTWNVLNNLIGCREPKLRRGRFNLGGYCNPKVDALAAKVFVENDAAKRNALIDEALQIVRADVAYIPLHQQALAWGVAKRVKLKQRADNVLQFRFVTIK